MEPYHFNFPPITELTIAQQAALNEHQPIAISGGPGTGKSLVSLWRHIRNHQLGQHESLLLTYTKTLSTFFATAARSIDTTAASHVKRTYRWVFSQSSNYYDEIIIDEAQDVSSKNYEVIKRRGRTISYGADNAQSLYPDQATTEEQLHHLFSENINHRLQENFRNTYEILRFVRSILPNRHIPQSTFDFLLEDNRRGNKPILLKTNNQNDAMLEIINAYRSATHNIAVLFPLTAEVNDCYNFLTAQGIGCTKFQHQMDELIQIGNIHVTTFKSSKGTEFDTVILPDFQKFNYNLANLRVVTENDYYVALTRAKRNLILISDRDLGFLSPDTYETETF